MIDLINQHKTIRKYKNIPVEDKILDKILEAGSRASTTGNMQVYSIVVTKNIERKKKLWELHFKQDMVLQAPVLLTFCADFNRFSKWCELREAAPGYDNFLSFFTAAIDALLVSQNVALAAEAEGLGICYLGTTTYTVDKIIEFLECPPLVVPVTTLVVGYPDETPGLTDRLPLKAVIHYEKYLDYSDNSINDIYSEKENLPFTKELLKINDLPNLAKIFTEKRYTRKDNEYFSKVFIDVLTKQGYLK
ncbi:MAG: nitroreductase family protein [Bacteroidales bacterium]|nr:nitroreductase family protein [Bacteroidales bacterium]